MKGFVSRAALLAAIAVIPAACSTPRYVEKGNEGSVPTLGGTVTYKVHPLMESAPPACVAILPFTPGDDGVTKEETDGVRRAIYAHLAPQGKKDVELARVDFVLGKLGAKAERAELGRQLKCDAVLEGTVREIGTTFLGVYSNVSAGAELRLVRVSDGALLWEASHVASSHGGSVPLSPTGLVMGIFSAADNVSEEQQRRILDDLARRLVSTIPDNRMAVAEEIDPVVVVDAAPPAKGDARALLAQLEGKSPAERAAALDAALASGEYRGEAAGQLHRARIAIDPAAPGPHLAYAQHLSEGGDYAGALVEAQGVATRDPGQDGAQFMAGRMLTKLDRPAEAQGFFVKAIAANESNASYYNGLGYAASLAGNDQRALAAYQMAVDKDPANGFAYYNSGVLLFRNGALPEAADAFYGAGLAYAKQGRMAEAHKALTDLRQLAQAGVDTSAEAQQLADTLTELSTKELANEKAI